MGFGKANSCRRLDLIAGHGLGGTVCLRRVKRPLGPLVVHPLCASESVGTVGASYGARSAGGSEPVSTPHHLAAKDARPRPSRLTLNEQLRFFGAASEA